MSGALMDYVNVREIFVPVMPAVQSYHCDVSMPYGRKGSITVLAGNLDEATTQIDAVRASHFNNAPRGEIFEGE